MAPRSYYWFWLGWEFLGLLCGSLITWLRLLSLQRLSRGIFSCILFLLPFSRVPGCVWAVISPDLWQSFASEFHILCPVSVYVPPSPLHIYSHAAKCQINVYMVGMSWSGGRRVCIVAGREVVYRGGGSFIFLVQSLFMFLHLRCTLTLMLQNRFTIHMCIQGSNWPSQKLAEFWSTIPISKCPSHCNFENYYQFALRWCRKYFHFFPSDILQIL